MNVFQLKSVSFIEAKEKANEQEYDTLEQNVQQLIQQGLSFSWKKNTQKQTF